MWTTKAARGCLQRPPGNRKTLRQDRRDPPADAEAGGVRTHRRDAPGLLVGHPDHVGAAGVEEEVAGAFSDMQLRLRGGRAGVRGEGSPGVATGAAGWGWGGRTCTSGWL